MLRSILSNTRSNTRQFSLASSTTSRLFSTSSSLFNTSSSSASTSKSNPLLSHLDPSSLPSTIKNSTSSQKTLYQHLSTLPSDGIGSRVRQKRWLSKGLDLPAGHALNGQIQQAQKDTPPLCYWTISRVALKHDGAHGKAWGRLTWRGKEVTPAGKDERIRGGLKYLWESAH